MAERWCKVCKGWHDPAEPWPGECWTEPERQRSDIVCPRFIRDEIDPVQSMASGKMYTSKSKLRAEYKALGVVEVGNDSSLQSNTWKPKKVTHEEVRPAVEKALSKAGLGENPTVTGMK